MRGASLAEWFRQLPAVVRRPIVALQLIVFVWLVFVLVPDAAIDLNEDLGWPRFESAVARAVGIALIAAGVGVSFHCVSVFARTGLGTPVPSAPPKHLVERGLYRRSRHPMYVAYAAILLGVFLYFGHFMLLAYLVLYFLIAQAVIVWWEEPVLRKRFGDAYDDYVRRVRRWL